MSNATATKALITRLRNLSSGFEKAGKETSRCGYTGCDIVAGTLLEAADALEALKDAKCQFCRVNFQQGQSGLSAPAALIGVDGWIPWAGGDCPVDDEAPIYWRTRNGVERGPSPAGRRVWHHLDSLHDIVFYKIG